jgi:hypothetical protein
MRNEGTNRYNNRGHVANISSKCTTRGTPRTGIFGEIGLILNADEIVVVEIHLYMKQQKKMLINVRHFGVLLVEAAHNFLLGDFITIRQS